MPAEGSPSQGKRPSIDHARSGSSQRSLRSRNEGSDSPSSTPPSTHKAPKAPKAHAVTHRIHSRVHSNKGLHKLTTLNDNHGTRHLRPETSPTSVKRNLSDSKLSRSHGSSSSLKRNKSNAEVKRPKSSAGLMKRSSSQPGVNNNKASKTGVHFDLGTDGQDDGWTEESGSASPELSRSLAGTSSGTPSVKQTNNSQPESPHESPAKTHAEVQDWQQKERQSTPDAQQITSRLLGRTPGQKAASPKMSSISATATPSTTATDSPSSTQRVNSHVESIPRSANDELVSRFKAPASGTPGSASPIPGDRRTSSPKPTSDVDIARRAKSMNNLTRRDSSFSTSEDDRALAPRARKSSQHAYNPPQQSRTQQKLWLQRASSNIEQQPNGATLPGLQVGPNASPLVGAGYDGRDPRIRLQLERTGLAYLVVRRYQDPVGRALKRLELLPGMEKMRRIPHGQQPQLQKRSGDGAGRFGLSQSLKDMRAAAGTAAGNGTLAPIGAESSFEENRPVTSGPGGGGSGSVGSAEAEGDEDELGTALRGLWEKSFEMSASAE